jgi:hypothetical protein
MSCFEISLLPSQGSECEFATLQQLTNISPKNRGENLLFRAFQGGFIFRMDFPILLISWGIPDCFSGPCGQTYRQMVPFFWGIAVFWHK